MNVRALPVADPNERSNPWPDGIDVLIFCGSIILFLYAGIIGLGALSALSGFSRVPDEQTMFRYGGTAVLIWLLLVGTISFLIGGFVVRRLRRVRARWIPIVVGGLYSFVFVGLSMFVPLSRGSLGSFALVTFLLLFPAVALLVGALKLKRSNNALEQTRNG